MLKYFAVIALAFCVGLAQAGEAQPVAEDPVLEARVQALAEVLRCLVCQNQNLADSHAELAIDLKNQVREMLRRGQTEKEVIDYLVQRYGDFVLYRPPVKSSTWLLWGGPFALFSAGLGMLYLNLRRRRQQGGEVLSAEERSAASSLLEGRTGEPK
ncbi:MAG: cytochrome c-type biogenesis protein CcmH [Rhodocyclales bacterium GT-UBC]|nr:MAG: cytochrome c-type biogenesis protein CcmH [Rhodocyclales bacterium GT-UBC]